MPTDICCPTFKTNLRLFSWFKLDENDYVMPHIKGSDMRLVYCPWCGKHIRDVMITNDVYNEIDG